MQALALDARRLASNGPGMTRTHLALCLVAAAALAGCSKQSHTIVAGGDPDYGNGANGAANAPVALPPTIVASKIYRCADNNVVYVDYLSDNKTANIRAKQDGLPTQVVAAEAGKPMTAAGGYSLTGSPASATATIAIPGHPSQSCKA
jgi:hypothetical protein